jgi:hypothetical protein
MYDVVLSAGGGGVGAWNAAAAACRGQILLQVVDDAVCLTTLLIVVLQLSDDWEPTIGWDEDILRALREGGGGQGVGLEEEWVLQVMCEV